MAPKTAVTKHCNLNQTDEMLAVA